MGSHCFRFKFIRRILVFCLLFYAATAAADKQTLQLQLPVGMCGYTDNRISVESPEKGMLRLEIKDEYATYRVLNQAVSPGEDVIFWDGLGWNEERLNKKQYIFYAELQGASGAVYSFTGRQYLETAGQAVLFALPSSDTLYLNEIEDWFFEFKLVRDGELRLQFYTDGSEDPKFSLRRTFSGGRINKCSLSAFPGSGQLAVGSYRVRCITEGDEKYAKEFFLEVIDGSKPLLPVQLTGAILPEPGASDAEIWALMQRPATVVDIPSTSHQKVFIEPNARSKSLGTLHGQTQSLQVFEIQKEWARVGAWNHESADYIEGWVPLKVLKVEKPQGDYGLLIDKKKQTMTVYYRGTVIDTLLVSTGRSEKNQLYQETAAGSFLTDLHRADFSTNGLKYDFVIRYDGGNLLHQLPYAWGEEKKDYRAGEVYLGTKASHACIRIQAKPGNGGINAYWLWTHLPYHTRVMILDDPEERMMERRIISGNTPKLTETETKEESWSVVADDAEELSSANYAVLTFGGDAVLGGRESYYELQEGLPAYLNQFGAEYPFTGLLSVFEEDDFTSVNLECVLKDDALGEDLTKRWRFRGLPSYADAFPLSSIEMVNVANNHTMDYGAEGYRSTLDALKGKALVCGNENNQVIEIKGRRFGFGGCREATYLQDPEVIERDVRALRDLGAEIIIYQCHWGTEYSENHNKLQEAMARCCARAGVNLVIGHHPHVVQGISFIDDMPVIYSLGNLVFGGTLRLQTYDGLLVQALFPLQSETQRPLLRLIPVRTSSLASERINDYQPVVAKEREKEIILQKVQNDSGFRLSDVLLP